MTKDLKNKIAIITGGSGFLGTQFCKTLAENGCLVINIDKKKNLSFERIIRANKLNIKFLKCNITKEKDLLETRNKILKSFKKIDILINNACNDYRPNKKNIKKLKLESLSNNVWQNDIDVGLTGSFLCTKIFGQTMIKQKKGVILNISSDLGIISPNQNLYKVKGKEVSIKPVTYSIIKHAIIGLTKYTATNWAEHNIRCNAICPGGMFNNHDKNFLKKIKNLIPMNRMAKFKEFNSSIVYLVSDASSYVNGHSLVIDGGRSIW